MRGSGSQFSLLPRGIPPAVPLAPVLTQAQSQDVLFDLERIADFLSGESELVLPNDPVFDSLVTVAVKEEQGSARVRRRRCELYRHSALAHALPASGDGRVGTKRSTSQMSAVIGDTEAGEGGRNSTSSTLQISFSTIN